MSAIEVEDREQQAANGEAKSLADRMVADGARELVVARRDFFAPLERLFNELELARRAIETAPAPNAHSKVKGDERSLETRIGDQRQARTESLAGIDKAIKAIEAIGHRNYIRVSGR